MGLVQNASTICPDRAVNLRHADQDAVLERGDCSAVGSIVDDDVDLHPLLLGKRDVGALVLMRMRAALAEMRIEARMRRMAEI